MDYRTAYTCRKLNNKITNWCPIHIFFSPSLAIMLQLMRQIFDHGVSISRPLDNPSSIPFRQISVKFSTGLYIFYLKSDLPSSYNFYSALQNQWKTITLSSSSDGMRSPISTNVVEFYFSNIQLYNLPSLGFDSNPL